MLPAEQTINSGLVSVTLCSGNAELRSSYSPKVNANGDEGEALIDFEFFEEFLRAAPVCGLDAANERSQDDDDRGDTEEVGVRGCLTKGHDDLEEVAMSLELL